MAKRLPDGEHREYYEDRSLKAVYTIKDGKKEGTYTQYEKNSDRIIFTEEYQGGELHGKRVEYSWGRPHITETYEHGTITEKRWNDNHYETYKDGQLHHVVIKDSRANVDMYYKDGKEYAGTYDVIKRIGGRDGDDFTQRYTLVDGNYHGEYVDEHNGVRVNYDMGVLHGRYRERQADGSIKEGEYNQGKFTGTIEPKDGKTIETWVDGKLDCIATYGNIEKDRWGYIISRGEITSEVRPNGACFEKLKDGRIIKYEQKDGKKDGIYEEFDKKGWLRERSFYVGGLCKQKTEYYSDGHIVNKDKDNMSDGEHREYYEDRTLKAIYTLKNGKKEGIYTEFDSWSSRPKLTESYSEGKLHGKRIEYAGEKPYYTETYEHGTITEKRWNDDHYETYKDGQLHHVVIKDSRANIDMYYKDGKEYEGTYYNLIRVGGRDGDDYTKRYTLVDGKYHGEYVDEQNGTSVNYDMGVLHGKYRERQADGSVKEGHYYQGRFAGTITSRDKLRIEQVDGEKSTFTGTITSEDGKILENWVDGSLECITTYKSAKKDWYGNVTSREGIISEIRPNGTCVEYSNGTPIKRYEQKNGKKDGLYEEFDPRGWVKVEAQYKNGELNGTYKEYNSDGTVASRRFYKDGKDITPQRKVLMKAAKENVQSTEGVSPRQSKLKKTTLAIKMAIAGIKRGKDK